MATKKVSDIRDVIAEHIKEIERDWSWLSRKTEIPYGTIYACFVQKDFRLSQGNLDKINEVLETDFEL